MPPLHLTTFKVDTAIPIGHPLCGGWIKPVVHTTEPLYAMGVVLLGGEAPVVLCAVDWTGICNDAHTVWREKLAAAVHTTPDRVAVHCVHQHNAPFADLTAEQLIQAHDKPATSLDVPWFHATVERVADAAKKALTTTHPVTHVGQGQGKVHGVASNRRLVSADGKLRGWRGSSCKDAKLKAEADGLIDPMLTSITFWNGTTKLAVLHYYATHPMSYYGDGLVTSDFVGLAREARAKEDSVLHVYFTGCSGDVAAGKYNDGDKPMRFLLARRIYDGMLAAEGAATRIPAGDLEWRIRPVVLPPRSDATAEELLKTLADATKPTAVRNRAAMKLSYRKRAEAKTPILLTTLHLGKAVAVLHMPSESFVDFQLYAQAQRPTGLVAAAAYGDGGPWYIPVVRAFSEGGYEPSVAFAEPESEAILKDGIKALLQG